MTKTNRSATESLTPNGSPLYSGKGQRGEGSKKILDVGDIAGLFGCSREKVKRMARSGELPAFKFGKTWYVFEDDLERFLSSRVESIRHLRRIQEVSP